MSYGPLAFLNAELETHGTVSARQLRWLAGTSSLAGPVLLLGSSSVSLFYHGISDCLSLFHSPLAAALLYFQRHYNKHNLFCAAVTFLNMASLPCNVHGLGLSYRNVFALIPRACSRHWGCEGSVTSQGDCSPHHSRLPHAHRKDNLNCSRQP